MPILGEEECWGYNKKHPMHKIKSPWRYFSDRLQSASARSSKWIYVLLILPAGFLWFLSASTMRAGLPDQEPAGNAQQTQTSLTKTDGQSAPQTPPDAAAAQEDSDLAQVQAEVKAVHAPDAHALAKALGIDPAASGGNAADSPASSLQDLGDLDGSGVSEFALKWMPPLKADANELPTWQLTLLAWDGADWRASRIKTGFEPYELQVLSSLIPGSRQIALVIYLGARAIPYPAIYQIKDHAAALVWDGHSDESLYEGFAQGRIEFRNSDEGATPVMIASGRADPGLLHFPKGSPRGFDVQTIYVWDGRGFTPKRTQYQANEDYKIYQFISALHLHDYRAAYALIDPPKFLKTGAPSLEMFRRKIQASWPEFLDDQIFEIPEANPATPNGLAFELNNNDEDQHYIYAPSFGAGSKLLITGLERHSGSSGERKSAN